MDVHYRAADGKNSTPVSDAAPLPVKALAYDGTGNANDAGHPVFAQLTTGSALAGQFATQSSTGGIKAGLATYVACGTGYAAYATPTDMLCIFGSDTKTVVVTDLLVESGSTSTALITYHWVKRNTANTGGTKTNPTPVALDSVDPVPTAAVSLYTAAPTLGTSLGDVRLDSAVTAATTSTPTLRNLASVVGSYNLTDVRKPIILRGANEGLCLNFAGASLPSGYTAIWLVQWCEF